MIDLLTVKEVSAMLNVSPMTVYYWKYSGILPFHKLGGRIRFDKNDIMKFLYDGKRNCVNC